MSNVATAPFRIASYHSNYTAQCAVSDFRPRPSCPSPGFVPELLHIILTLMNVSYEIVPLSLEYVSFDSEHLIYILRDTAIGEFDMVAALFSPIAMDAVTFWESSHGLRQSFPIRPSDSFGSLTNKLHGFGSFRASVLQPFGVFDAYSWISFILWYFSVKLALHWLGRDTFGYNLLLWNLAFFFTLFSNLYRGKLLAELLGMQRPVQYTDPWKVLDAINQGRLTPVVHIQMNMLEEDRFLSAVQRLGGPYDAAIIQATREHGIFTTNKTLSETILMTLERDDYIFGGAFESAMPIYKSISCDVEFIGTQDHARSQSFPFWPNSSYLELFNRAALQVQDHKDNIWAKYERIRNEVVFCEKEDSKKKQVFPEPLCLFHVWGSFASLEFGLSASFLVFLLEQAGRVWIRKQRRRSFQVDNTHAVKERLERHLVRLSSLHGHQLTWPVINELDQLVYLLRDEIDQIKREGV